MKNYVAPGGMHVRVDSGLYTGYRVPPYYDSMIGKLIVYGVNREDCIMRLRRALEEFVVEGMKTTVPLHQKLVRDPEFLAGDYTIKWLERWLERSPTSLMRGNCLVSGAANSRYGTDRRRPSGPLRRTLRRSMPAATARPRSSSRRLPTISRPLCWMAAADGDIYWYNRRWYEYTGTSPDTQRGWGWESVHDPERLPEVTENWTRSLKTGEPFEMTFPLRGADGSFRLFLTRVVPIRDDTGAIIRWFGTNTDVSELKRVEDELRESRFQLAQQLAEMKALYDSAPIGLGFFSRDYRYLRINEELAAINGIAPADHIGRTIREVLGDDAPPVEPIIDQIFATGEAMRDLEVSGETPQQPRRGAALAGGLLPSQGQGRRGRGGRRLGDRDFRAQGGRAARASARPRGRSPRKEPAGGGAIGHAAHPRRVGRRA